MVLAGLCAGAARATAFPTITPDPDVQAMLSQVSTDTLHDYTAQLTGEEPIIVSDTTYTLTTRYTYSGEPIQRASQFVGEHLQAVGLDVEYHTWDASDMASTYPNVIGELTGSANPSDIYIIGAHLDDAPFIGAAPGADDNASGSAGTLIAADILSQYDWSCTLRFAFWTGEELGLLGSAAYASRARNANENIKGYLNMDMIGYNSAAPNRMSLFAISTVPGSLQMMDLYADVVNAYQLGLVPEKYIDDGMGFLSDNAAFWNNNYAAIMIGEDHYHDTTPYYHKTSDTLSTLDMAYYTDVVKASVATFVHLAGCMTTEPTPTPDPPVSIFLPLAAN